MGYALSLADFPAEKIVEVKSKAWYGDEKLELGFPERWDLTLCKMQGHDASALTDEEVREALRSPIGTKTLRDLADGKEQAVVLFDDMYRGTPASRLVPFVLEELKSGGIKDENIRFINAVGAHRVTTAVDWVKKLGEDVVANYPVYVHNCWDENCLIEVGTTSQGTQVRVNREYMECDVKVGIGGIKPHGFMGYGGGGKIILPGVSWIETIHQNHLRVAQARSKGQAGYGLINGNVIREDSEEAARMAGLDFKVDCVMNNNREVVGTFAGDFVKEHRAGVEFARQIYTTETPLNMDIVVVNGYPQEIQTTIGLWAARASVKEGGDVVLIARHPEGSFHYLGGRFGTKYGGYKDTWRSRTGPSVPKAKRLIVYSEYKIKKSEMTGFGTNPTWVKTWNEVLELLNQDFPSSAKVAVYPCGPIQHPQLPPEY